MLIHRLFFLLPGLALATPAMAQGIETITVTGDRVHLIETQPDDAAFGLAKPLLETPRSITVVSATTLDRYGIDGVDSLTAITPSSYTASFYGVEGAVNLRGTLADSYFRGFKRAENRGTYDTPLGDAAELEILRGPPSAIYGAGKVGGLFNFIPKSGVAADSDEVTVTYGSYSKRNLTGQAVLPLDLGFAAGGVHAYGEIDDSFSFYRGIHPSHQLLQLSGDLTAGAWSLSADYMYYHSNGDVQTPGWNRLTQTLIGQQHLHHRARYIAEGCGWKWPADPERVGRKSLRLRSQIHAALSGRALLRHLHGCGAYAGQRGGHDAPQPAHGLHRARCRFFQHRHPYRFCRTGRCAGRRRQNSFAGLC